MLKSKIKGFFFLVLENRPSGELYSWDDECLKQKGTWHMTSLVMENLQKIKIVLLFLCFKTTRYFLQHGRKESLQLLVYVISSEVEAVPSIKNNPLFYLCTFLALNSLWVLQHCCSKLNVHTNQLGIL